MLAHLEEQSDDAAIRYFLNKELNSPFPERSVLIAGMGRVSPEAFPRLVSLLHDVMSPKIATPQTSRPAPTKPKVKQKRKA